MLQIPEEFLSDGDADRFGFCVFIDKRQASAGRHTLFPRRHHPFTVSD